MCVDPRVNVALTALSILESFKKKGKIKGDLGKLKGTLEAMKWIDDPDYLKTKAEELKKFNYGFNKDEKGSKQIEWCLGILGDVSSKLERGTGTSILLGLDCALGEILSIHSIDRGLSVCRVHSKIGDFTIVTNLTIKKRNKIPFCILPPVEFQGIISEAMFVCDPVESLADVDWTRVEGKVSAVLQELKN